MVVPSVILAPTLGACRTGGESFVMQSSPSDFVPCHSLWMEVMAGFDAQRRCFQGCFAQLDKQCTAKQIGYSLSSMMQIAIWSLILASHKEC